MLVQTEQVMACTSSLNWFLLRFLLACLAIRARTAFADDNICVEIIPKDAEVRMMQAVCLRATIFVPEGGKSFEPECWPEDHPCLFLQMHVAGFRPVHNSIIKRRTLNQFSLRKGLNDRTKLKLLSGESISYSFAVAADWGGEIDGLYAASPFFEKFGNCELIWGYQAAPPRNFYSVTIKPTFNAQDEDVSEPAYSELFGDGVNRQPSAMISNDRILIDALLSPINSPDPDTTTKLRQIVEKYPKSSYRDYARFALARAVIKNDRTLPFTRKEMIKKIVKFVQWQNGKKKSVEDVARVAWDSHPVRGVRKAAIEAVLESVGRGVDEVEAVTSTKLVDLCYPSSKDRMDAIICLNAIDHGRFPYGAEALILLRELQLDAGLIDEARKSESLLDRDWYDNFDWLEEKSKSIESPEEWRKYRVRPWRGD